jgi:hypothetical protein
VQTQKYVDRADELLFGERTFGGPDDPLPQLLTGHGVFEPKTFPDLREGCAPNSVGVISQDIGDSSESGHR